MASWHTMIPRDVQLEILKRSDMDTRIALGIVGRLSVPQRVVDALTAIRRPADYWFLSRVDIGIYQLKYTKTLPSPYGLSPECWEVVVMKPSPSAMGVLEIQSIDVSHDRKTWMVH